MKKFTIIFIIGVVFSCSIKSQYPQWLNFTNGNEVRAVAAEGCCIWAGTNGGIVKFDTLTGEILFFNKANSGLFSNIINSIAIDAQGNKWFGTSFGVAKFDNSEWTVYETSNSGLPNNLVNSIAIDSQGNKWFGTGYSNYPGVSYGGLAKFDNANWIVYNTANSYLPDDEVRSITIDAQGNKWIGTGQGGVAKINNANNWTIYNHNNSGLPNNIIYSIAIDIQDIVWIATLGGFSKFDYPDWTNYEFSFPYNHISIIVADANGNKWFGTSGGVVKYDNTNLTFYNGSDIGLSVDDILAITIDDLGNKWFGNGEFWLESIEGGLVKFDNTNWTVYNTSNSGLPVNSYYSSTMDDDGNKWFGTDNGGVAEFDGTTWTVYNTSNSGLPDNDVISFGIDLEGNKWFGTDDGGVAKFDNINWTVYKSSNSGLPHSHIASISIDLEGNKWFGTLSGVAKFDGFNWTVYNTSNSGLPNNIVGSISIDAQGNKWFGTSIGVAKFDNTNWTIYNSANSGLPNNVVWSIAIDSEGNKWIGTGEQNIFGGGVVKFDGTNWTSYNTTNSGLPDDYVQSISIDSEGNKWFGTIYGGVAKFDNTNWTVYNRYNSGLPTNNIKSIEIDVHGNKWFLTNNGVGVFNENGIILSTPAWNPILKDQKMNYRHSDSAAITNSIRVDSVQSTESGVNYYLNKVVVDVPYNSQYVLRDHPQFYSAYFTEQEYGIWLTEQFILKTKDSLGSSWLFDPSNNIQAEVTDINADEIFGVMDSVKTISLSNENVIKLSKSYGIIQFPDFVSGGYYELVGLQNTLGESLPDFEDIYDFEVGDVFQYADYLMDPFGSGYITRKITITSKQINTNGYSYNYDGIYHIVYFEASGGGGTDYYTYNDTFTFTDSLNHPANLFPGQLMLLPNSSSGMGTENVYCRAKVVFDPEWNSVTKEFGLKEFDNNPNNYQYDLFYELDPGSDTLYRFEQIGGMIEMPCGTKGLGFGNFIGNTYSNNGCFEFEGDSVLVGYIKGVDTVGIITPDSLLLNGIFYNPQHHSDIMVYPNPAKKFVHFDFPGETQNGQYLIEISNISGEIILRKSVSCDASVNTSKLKPGLYFYTIKTGNYDLQHGKIIIN